MNKQIIISFFFCLGIAIALAYPTDEFYTPGENHQVNLAAENNFDLKRAKRQIDMEGSSITKTGTGHDIVGKASFPIWASRNERNFLDGSVGYSQHVSPYGNSRPDYQSRVTFTHNF